MIFSCTSLCTHLTIFMFARWCIAFIQKCQMSFVSETCQIKLCVVSHDDLRNVAAAVTMETTAWGWRGLEQMSALKINCLWNCLTKLYASNIAKVWDYFQPTIRAPKPEPLITPPLCLLGWDQVNMQTNMIFNFQNQDVPLVSENFLGEILVYGYPVSLRSKLNAHSASH